MAKVTGVSNESPLFGKIFVDDEVTRLNGREFVDLIDYAYADSFEEGTITVIREGKPSEIAFQKDYPEQTLGLEFDSSVEITPVECCNNCIFCFVKQLPEGLRNTLYVKDDDYRLSFISGSYITCTNLKEKDVQRILDYKLSPLYISVHATDEEVRKYMLGIKRAPAQMPMLKRFIDAGIVLNAQIVLVPGVNDGAILKKSLDDLLELGVNTVAIVPVGLTEHRQGLQKLRRQTKEEAREAIAIAEEYYQKKPYFCFCADEMYQVAEMDVPDGSYYGSYDQIENGVGLIAKFNEEVDYALSKKTHFVHRHSVAVLTGVSAESVIKAAAKKVMQAYPKVTIHVYAVENDFFGRTVTVTGLVTATDILKKFSSIGLTEDYVAIPSVMLKEFGDVFLDDTDVCSLEKKLGKKIVVTPSTGEGFVHAVLRGDKK
ncbi:MAG: DUF512 domain-containing protein [Clostridia bacterium]|nr:DUF512 domain-containing protein [Clostridia bacterium]